MAKKPEVFVRTPFNYDMDAASLENATRPVGLSMTKQQFAEECDINTIVRRFGLTGELPQNVRMPTYGDFTNVRDFKTAMDALALANEAFDEMPAEVRARFDNDPEKFVAFCDDDANREEAEKLGLVRPPLDASGTPAGAPAAAAAPAATPGSTSQPAAAPKAP